MPVEFCHSVIQWDWVWEINYKSLEIFYAVNLPPSLNMDVDVAIISPNAIFM